MITTYQIKNKNYTAIEIEHIVTLHNYYTERASKFCEKHKTPTKLGDRFVDAVLNHYDEVMSKPAATEQKPTTNLGTTIYLRYNEDDSYVYLAIRFRNGVPVANHPPVGGSTIVQTSNSPTGPWSNSSFYTS